MSDGRAIVELREGDYISTVWFASSPRRDFMGTLWKTKDGEWKCVVRMRTYDPGTTKWLGGKDKDPFSDNDKKLSVSLKLTPLLSEDDYVRDIGEWFKGAEKLLSMEGEPYCRYLSIKGGVEKFAEMIKSEPAFHTRQGGRAN